MLPFANQLIEKPFLTQGQPGGAAVWSGGDGNELTQCGLDECILLMDENGQQIK